MSEREAAVLGAPKLFKCPECIERFEKPEELGSHLERHREVTPPSDPSPRGKPRSFPCPKDCGRYFKRLTDNDARAHLLLCDGSEPLVVVIDERKEDPVAKLECPKCGKEYLRGGKKFDKHVKDCEEEAPAGSEAAGGGAPEPAERPAAAAIAAESDASVKDTVLEMLDTLEIRYTEKLKEVKRLIVAVRGVEEAD